MYHPSLIKASTRERTIAAQTQVRPLSPDSQIFILERVISAIENLRSFHYAIGDISGARLHAVRIGIKRSELRRIKAQ